MNSPPPNQRGWSVPNVLTISPRTNPPHSKRKRAKLAPLAVDAKQLARLLSVGVRTIRTWDAAGKLPTPARVVGRTLWYLPEIRSWLKAGAPPRDEWEVRKAALSN